MGDAAAAIVARFNACIGAQDLDGLAALMTDDHRFIDTAGAIVAGKAACTQAWRGFFAAFPDYRNVLEHVQVVGDSVAMRGRSICSDARLDGPALWRAQLRGALIGEWRVFDDIPANRRVLGLDP